MTPDPHVLRYGINLTSTHSATSPPEAQIAEHRESIANARRFGFDLIIAGQHFASPELRYFQPIPYLASLTEETQPMRLAVGIALLPLLHPLALAEEIATLDAVSEGRAVLGLGIGYSQRELDAFGIERSTRIARFEESIGLLRRLLAGETIDHDGDFFRFDSVASSTLPVEPAGIPLWIGAQATPSVRRAARLADAWYVPPFPTHRELVALWADYLDVRPGAADEAGFELPVRREIFITDSRAEAMEAIRLAEQRYAIYASWGLDMAADYDESRWMESRFIVGDPDTVAERITMLRDAVPFTHLIFKPQWVGMEHRDAMAQFERFGTEVIPRLTPAR